MHRSYALFTAIIFSFFCLIICLLPLQQINTTHRPTIGSVMPPITASLLHQPEHKQLIALSSAQITLIHIWSSWCSTCRHELPFLRSLAADTRWRLIGIYYKDVIEQARAIDLAANIFAESYIDYDGQLGFSLGVFATPETWIINQQGILIDRIIGELNPRRWQAIVTQHHLS